MTGLDLCMGEKNRFIGYFMRGMIRNYKKSVKDCCHKKCKVILIISLFHQRLSKLFLI
jgi:hypothetical protein